MTDPISHVNVLPFDAVRNFRDLGGYPTLDGSVTRCGQVFRSGRLDRRTKTDTDLLVSLGISTVFDLRTTKEVESRPDRLPDVINHVHLPMSSDITQQLGLFDRILAGQMSGFTKVDMADGYLRMLENFPEHLAQIVRAVAVGEKILFHCAAGKDRTGITAMVMLGIAEVADSFVLDDYEQSAAHQRAGVVENFAAAVKEQGLDLERFDLPAMMGAPRQVMKMTLDGVRERWTNHAGFQATLGLTPGELAAAKRNLRLDPV